MAFDWKLYNGNLTWLPERTIFMARHGSKAYGTSLPTSDEDFRGVAIAPREYTDGRRPDSVTFLDTIEQDLARRDFTINAIAYDPVKHKMCDPFCGYDDIVELGAIRAVGIPDERFREDGLRMLRAARFSATLGFYIEPKTSDGMFANIEMLDNVVMEPT